MKAKKRSGVTMPTVMAMLAVVITMMFVNISADMVLKPEDYIRENSVFLVSERVSSATYAMDSMEKAELELDLEAEYVIEKRRNENFAYISYGEGRDAIKPGVRYTVETGNSSKICITKDPGSNPRIIPEGC